MPLVPSIVDTSKVFWNTEDILNFARVLVNDAQAGLEGQDLADSRPYTWVLLNLCYAKLANWLEDADVESATYKVTDPFITLPAGASSTDPNATSKLAYDGFYDAQGNRFPTPTLPDDFLEPLDIWQRTSGTNSDFLPIGQRLGGLGNRRGGGSLLGRWEFIQNALRFEGWTFQPVDLKIRYIPALPVLVQPGAGQPAPQIPFARAGEALAYMVAAEFQEIRNAPNAPILRAKANEQLEIIANKSAKRENQAESRRRGYGFNRRRAWL